MPATFFSCRAARRPAGARKVGVEMDLGTNAMVMRNMWAPRLGVLYDWTKEGRSKIYGHWGRFYESIPMDINDRSFGGEVLYHQYFDSGTQWTGRMISSTAWVSSTSGASCASA